MRLSVSCRAGGDGEQGGEKEEEESPESLFARELQRRGMAPGAAPSAAGEKQAEEGGAEAGTKRRATAAAEFERRAAAGGGADGQRERSMALNSEGLEVCDSFVRALLHSCLTMMKAAIFHSLTVPDLKKIILLKLRFAKPQF